MKSKVYTLTGDKGTTALVGGKRVAKDDARVEAYGTIDELNAHLGLLAHNTKLDENMPKLIRKIQNKLFNMTSIGYQHRPGTRNAAELHQLRHLCIDEMDAELPPMQGFILPGGSRLSALCDICRTVTRRAERRVVALSHTATVHPLVLQYLNRLSDFFFVFARFNNIQNQVEEIYWEK